jgi:very-short-patch-repair endonuclease
MADQKHKPKWHVSERQRSDAKAKRREITEAERIICCNGPRRRFQGVSFPRQAPVGPYVLDFVCHAAKLIVEVDGGQHFEPKTTVRNAPRDAYLAAQSCGVVRLNNRDVMKNQAGVLAEIAVALGGSETASLILRRSRRKGPGHHGREDVP